MPMQSDLPFSALLGPVRYHLLCLLLLLKLIHYVLILSSKSQRFESTWLVFLGVEMFPYLSPWFRTLTAM